MKKTYKIFGLIFSLMILVPSCTEVELIEPQINLGTKSTSTAIKSLKQTDGIVTAVFETTVGAKYSVQIVPFGSETPIKKEGFTASDIITEKVYDLSGEEKKDYELVFIDISGKEAKQPLSIK